MGFHKIIGEAASYFADVIAIVRITFRFIRRIISLRSARTRKQKRVKENMSMAF
jgi:uncharacterized DUF497 family protein